MHLKKPIGAAFVAAALTLSPAVALAQDANNTATDAELNTTDTTDINTTDTQYEGQQREEDNDFPWGLLGLLGLAGLAGLKRRDSGDIHVDARRNP